MKSGLHINTANTSNLMEHYNHCGENLRLGIEQQHPLSEYIEKILTYAVLYEYWENDLLTGLAAVYENRGAEYPAYLTCMSIVTESLGKKIASRIMQLVIESLKNKKISLLTLEVHKNNTAALGLYEKFGFSIVCESEKRKNFWIMQLSLF